MRKTVFRQGVGMVEAGSVPPWHRRIPEWHLELRPWCEQQGIDHRFVVRIDIVHDDSDVVPDDSDELTAYIFRITTDEGGRVTIDPLTNQAVQTIEHYPVFSIDLLTEQFLTETESEELGVRVMQPGFSREEFHKDILGKRTVSV